MSSDLFEKSERRLDWRRLGEDVLEEIRRRFANEHDLLAKFVSLSERKGWLGDKLLPIREGTKTDIVWTLSQFAIFFENTGNIALRELAKAPQDDAQRKGVLLLYRIAATLDPLSLGASIGMVTFHKEFGNRLDAERSLGILKETYHRIMSSKPEDLGRQQRALAEMERNPEIKDRIAKQGFGMPSETFKDRIIALEREVHSGRPQLSDAQQMRAIDILLEHVPQGFWDDFRADLKQSKSDGMFVGQGFRNCLRLHGFLDKESPTGSLDDVWEDVAVKAALAAEREDWASRRKKWPSRRLRNDIQGFSRTLGERIWSYCYKSSEGFLAELIQADAERRTALSANQFSVKREILISTMWVITDNWKLDKEPLEIMHDCFFHYAGIADETNPDNAATLRDINERYNFLFQAKEGGTASFLSCFMMDILRAADSHSTNDADCERARAYYFRVVEGMKESF